MNKVLLIDKPAGWTSFDVVAKVRNTLNTKYKIQNTKEPKSKQPKANGPRLRVGHSGTLDPFATGLLIILVGDATKEQDKFMKLDKEYEATLKLGHTSTTGDPEGTINQLPTANHQSPNLEEIKKILKKFEGEIEQTPPAYSAIKVDGKRAYKLAREGKEVKLEPRQITINDISIISYAYPKLKILVSCSSGTYIRTLAEDIGKALGSGAYLTELRRTKIGKHDIKDAKSIEVTLPEL